MSTPSSVSRALSASDASLKLTARRLPIPQEYTRTQAQHQAIQKIFDQSVNRILKNQGRILAVGMLAGIAITWVWVKPESMVGGIITTYGGMVLGPFLAFPFMCALSEKEVKSPSGHSSLEQLPNDLYSHMTKFLTVRDIARISASRTTMYLTTLARTQNKHLVISGYQMKDHDLLTALNLHPNIHSFTLSRCPNITIEGIRALGQALKDRMLRSLTIILPQLTPVEVIGNTDQEIWLKFFENLNFSKLEFLNCAFLQDPKKPLDSKFCEKLSSSSLRRFFLLYPKRPWSIMSSKSFLQSLPNTIEDLFLDPEISLTEEIIDIIIERMNPSTLLNCAFSFNEPISDQKTLELMNFLPLQQMERVQFTGRSFPLKPAILHCIAEKISSNKKLRRFGIGNSTRMNEDISFSPIILALNSPNLREIALWNEQNNDHRHDFHRYAQLKYLFILQSVRWSNPAVWFQCKVGYKGRTFIDLKINAVALSEARTFFQEFDSLLHQLILAGKKVPAELRQKQLLLLSLESQLISTPLLLILEHYAELHNTLNPPHPITIIDTLEYYGKIPNPPEDLTLLQSLDLIRRLEQLHLTEAKRLEAAEVAAMQQIDEVRDTRVQEKLFQLYAKEKEIRTKSLKPEVQR